MVTIALYNLKGGVGKTAASINLSYLSTKEGYKTLVWDMDPQGSSSFYLGVSAGSGNDTKKLFSSDKELSDLIQSSPYPNLDVIPADLSARHADILLSDMKQSKKKIASLLNPLKKEYDIVFLDCSPGISLLHEAVFAGADWVLMPNIPTTLSIRSYETVRDYFRENDIDAGKLKCFFSMVDHRKNLHHEVMHSFYKDKFFFKNYIPYLSDVEKMGVHEAPLETYAPSSYAAQCFRDLWKEIRKTCID
ncbi:ParA family protein [Sediminibacterium soli]|uniref:ParA family protein n=1 Tax=Sediminibacterium soli TaxID=2698829 RepID=UPI00137B4F9B|nr:AAA family ATPase [Sediminibacterium soli]NCI45122.1 AAA family ATPase [Sediminibacterium soli]